MLDEWNSARSVGGSSFHNDIVLIVCLFEYAYVLFVLMFTFKIILIQSIYTDTNKQNQLMGIASPGLIQKK